MGDFDGELYLRCLGERTLLARKYFHAFSGPVAEQARVLVALGCLDIAAAQRVVDDYARAAFLRGLGGVPRHRTSAGASAAVPLTQHRVVACRRTFPQPAGELQVRYLIFSDAGTRLAVTFRPAPGALSRGPRRRGFPGPRLTYGGAPSLTVTDDRGTTGSGGFSGGGSDEEWRGSYDIQPALAPETAWIELLGERVELAAVDDRAVTVETFTDTDPRDVVDRYLDRYLACSTDHPTTPSIVDVIEALTAAGLLPPDDPRIAETLDIRTALIGHGNFVVPGLREPWRSLLAGRGRTGGPAATLLIGAVTPVFGGISAALRDLESDKDGFHCEFLLSGRIAIGMHNTADITAVPVSFTARDDRGNHYLAGLGDWHGGDTHLAGTLDFWPALDPRAQLLDLALTTDHARATISVPLTWDAP